VHGARDDFLADAAFAGDKDRDAGLGAALAQPFDHLHGRRFTDEIVEGGAAGGVLLEPLDLALQRAHVQRVADGDEDPFGRGRLDEEVERAGLHRLDDGLDAAGRGDDDHRLVEAAGAHLDQGVLARDAGHDEVQQDHVDLGARVQALDRLVAAFSMGDRETFPLKHSLNKPALCRVVVHHQDGFSHLKTPT